MRFNSGELELIKNIFGGAQGEHVLQLLRKVFLPEYDPAAPLGQAFDLWMTMDITQMHPEAAYQHMLARNQVITHVDQQLMQLQILAGMESVTPEEATTAKKKDSSK